MNILLTGASRGIGAATLDHLRGAGHRVVGHSTAGHDGLIAADFTDAAAPRALWDAALAELGSIDVLVNNAGCSRASPTMPTTMHGTRRGAAR
jgi:NAD(P)-dependent dehydrogenase (short-subunit alcohol dehydrogenase family)